MNDKKAKARTVVGIAKEKGVAGGSLKELEERLERFKTDQGK